jgi:hypothetical protein
MNKQDFKNLPNEEKMKMIYELLDMVDDYALKCFTAGWKRVPTTISLWDRQSVDKMINEYGKEAVRDGFIAARENGVEKLTYVRNVAKDKYEKKSIQTNIEKHEELKKEEKTWNPKEDPTWNGVANSFKMVDEKEMTKEEWLKKNGYYKGWETEYNKYKQQFIKLDLENDDEYQKLLTEQLNAKKI